MGGAGDGGGGAGDGWGEGAGVCGPGVGAAVGGGGGVGVGEGYESQVAWPPHANSKSATVLLHATCALDLATQMSGCIGVLCVGYPRP